MALSFTGATDKVDCGTNASTANIRTVTYATWIYRISSPDSRFWQRGLGATAYNFGGGTGTVFAAITRATVDCSAETAFANLAAYGLNKWIFLAAVLNSSGADGDQHLYAGDETTKAVEATSYSSSQRAGSGAEADNSAATLTLGNKSNDNAVLSGNMAWFGMWNRAMALSEIQGQQFFPSPSSGCLLFMRFNNSTTGTQLDQSGLQNKGTVSGAVVSTIADPANVYFDHFPKANIIRPRPFKPGLPR